MHQGVRVNLSDRKKAQSFRFWAMTEIPRRREKRSETSETSETSNDGGGHFLGGGSPIGPVDRTNGVYQAHPGKGKDLTKRGKDEKG